MNHVCDRIRIRGPLKSEVRGRSGVQGMTDNGAMGCGLDRGR